MSDDAWWRHHHKTSVVWLVTRIHQMLNGDDPKEIESIIRKTLPDFAKEVGVNLDEVRLS